MKDIVSLLLTTSCLAIAGLGIYFFSYNSHENSDVNQKAGKKKTFASAKKQSEVGNIYDNDYYDDDDDESSIDNQSHNHMDDYTNTDSNTDYKYKSKSKQKSNNNNKTKKNGNKFASSKKKYY
jgi:hypothetical protein